MTQDDEEKMAFYTNQGMYCYTKMPFGLKSAGATYHRLVDITFQYQMGRNLEEYVDDIVIKINDEGMIIADIAEKFDNLRKINMKLNLKKCSFGVEERKCLGYMVTTEGIRANLKKTKEIIGMQSPKTLKEMQSLSGKAVVANHPQKGRNVVCILSGIRERREYSFISRKKWETMPNTLSREEVKQSQKKLFTDREISSLFTAHVAEVTTIQSKDVVGTWTLFIDGASNCKGSKAGLVLISPEGTEFTYALRLNFTSTNNEAEYEALLEGLRLAERMKVQTIDVKVDSNLVVR
nr:retrotransposon protein, putative, Ty3-gypsy subclass [Tanacetum cinerariifolium]